MLDCPIEFPTLLKKTSLDTDERNGAIQNLLKKGRIRFPILPL
jgi:hypothetical protein